MEAADMRVVEFQKMVDTVFNYTNNVVGFYYRFIPYAFAEQPSLVSCLSDLVYFFFVEVWVVFARVGQ